MRRMKLGFVMMCLVLFATVLFSQLAFGQEKTRTLEHRRYKYKNEPVAVVSREVLDKSFVNESQIVSGSNWLRNLSLGIKNISSKNITYIEIHLVVDNPSKLPVQDSVAIRFTGWPTAKDNTEFSKNGGRRAVLKPGEVTKLSVSEQISSGVSRYLENLETEDFDKVSIDIRYVHFDDGTGWAVGHEMRQDPERPGSLVPLRDKPWSSLDRPVDWMRPIAFFESKKP